MTRLPLIILIASSLLLGGCQSRESAQVPRPTAYPRAALYGADYHVVDTVPLRVAVNKNAATTVSHPDNRTAHISVRYPRYAATLHITAIAPRSAAAVDSLIAMRRQRIALNLGASTARETRYASASRRLDATLFEASTACPSPLQLIATANDGSGEILSATLFFDAPSAAGDSLRPVVNALRADILAMLDSL